MQVKSFKKWDIDVNEMATNNGIIGSDLDRTKEWERWFTTTPELIKLISDKISAAKDKLYLYGSSTYYLTNEYNNYLGHIEFDNDKIVNSFSKLKGGFYTLMFTQILANSNKKKILSDTSLSPAAIRSYEKLSKTDNSSTKNFKINILLPNGDIIPFDKNILLDDGYTRVIITEHICNMKVNSFINKIHLIDESINYPGFYRQKWLANDPFCDMWLYGEHIIH